MASWRLGRGVHFRHPPVSCVVVDGGFSVDCVQFSQAPGFGVVVSTDDFRVIAVDVEARHVFWHAESYSHHVLPDRKKK